MKKSFVMDVKKLPLLESDTSANSVTTLIFATIAFLNPIMITNMPLMLIDDQ